MTTMLTSFLYVALKALQQLNVVHHRYAWIIPVSYGMAACEVFLYGVIAIAAVEAHDKFMLVVEIGSGAGLGAVCAMWLHHWARNR